MKQKLLLALFALSFTLNAWAQTFTALIAEGVEMTFNVTNSTTKECEVYGTFLTPSIPIDYSGSITIPVEVNGYEVKVIGHYAFNGCTGLTSIKIPNSVTRIRENAFYGCAGLTFIGIPNSVTSIGGWAFFGCTGLTSIKIPNSVTSIGGWAFFGCSSLTSIEIPSSVTSIGSSAFFGCTGLTSIEIPSSVTTIEDGTFRDCASLTSIKIPSSVTTIGIYAFEGCSGLTSIEIPNSVTTIGIYAFSGCTGLTSIKIPNSVTTIGNHIFQNCTGLTFIEIPNSVTSIKSYAFEGCSGLTSIEIPNSVTSIGESAFAYCTGLTSIEIPNSVTTIGGCAFENCTSLTSIEIPSSVTAIEDGTFRDCASLTSIKIPNSVTTIGYLAFSDCSGLTSIEIPNSVTSIGNSALFGCTGLTSIEIPSSVTTIGGGAFSGCTGLTSIKIPNSVTIIESSAFSGCSGLTSIEIPNSVTTIGGGAFSGCTGLTSIKIPNSVTIIESSAFSGCSGLTSIEIPNSVTTIEDRTFSGCIGLISIEIPNSVTTIEDRTFSGCIGLISIEIPNSVTSIGNSAFSGCTSLTSIEIPNSVTTIGNHIFQNCTGLTFIEIPNSVTSIKSYAFEGCSGLTSIEIPNSVTSIGESAFAYCTGLTSIEIPNSVTSIGTSAFSGCTGLTSIEIPNSVTSIKSYAFYRCRGLTSIEIPNSVTSIGNSAFSGCTSLTTVISHILVPFATSECFDKGIYKNAILYVPAGSIELYRNTEEWMFFNNLKPLSIKVSQTKVIRELERLHIRVTFSSEPFDYSSLDDYVNISSSNDTLPLLSFEKSGSSWDLYFELPKKDGTYTMRISNTLMDISKQEIDQNENFTTGEEEDNYIEEFIFGVNELYVIAQSPLSGMKGKAGYTDVVFNEDIEEIPLSQVSLVSPTEKEAQITSIDYIGNAVPTRHRVYYEALDEDGRYTFTISKDLKSTKGKEMYYDYQSAIELPCADLKPTSIDTEYNWISNQPRTITYQVTNDGTMPAVGKSVDVLYLSQSESWSNEAIEIYRDTMDVNLEPQVGYTKKIDFMVMPCAEGQYYLILKTNVVRTINELSYNDNMLTSVPLNISVEYLPNENNQFTLVRGESRLFKVPVVSDKNIEIQDKHGIANMFLGCFDIPNTNDEPRTGNVTITSPDASMTYYLLVTNNSQNQEKVQPCELGIRQFDIEIASVGRSNVVKHKTAWIPIEVNGCTDMPIFYLTNKQGKQTECKDVYAKSESSFYALFDTETLQTGIYNLYVECDGKTGMMSNVITVTQEEAHPSINSKLVLPSTSRIGSTITAYIDYKNTGNVDIPAPLFILTGQEGSSYELPTGGTFTSEAHIIGVNENGVVSALLPGESNRISVNITIPNQQIYTADYKLKTITEGCDGIDEPFYLQWLDVEPSETPSCYTDEEWNAYCTRLRNNVGDTWQTFIEALGTVAENVFSANYVEHDAHILYSILKEIDLNALDFDLESNHASKKKVLDDKDDKDDKDDEDDGNNGDDGDEPGMVFLFDGNDWLPLVEAVYDTTLIYNDYGGRQEVLIFRRWKQTEHSSKLDSTKYFFISHGMRNNHHQEWIKNMAQALYKHGKIISVCWGRWSKGPIHGILPWEAASHIDAVWQRVHDALNVVFDGNPDLSKFHFIGHSHGSHVCGRLANSYLVGPKRLTALDESEESDHWFTSYYNRGGRYKAEYIDYYKSSIICGTEYLVGDDNFILSQDDNRFRFSNIKDDGDKHTYATKWFTETIKEDKGLGFHWNRGNHEKVRTYGGDKNKKAIGWSGVINGPKMIIENYSNSKYKDSIDWNYPTPWYNPKKNQKKPDEGEFYSAFASTIDYKPQKLEHYGSNDYIQAGTTDYMKMEVDNNADNLSVPLDARFWTCLYAHQVLFVSKKSNDKESVSCDKDNISYVNTYTDLYYLSARYDYIRPGDSPNKSFSFNITPKLWKDLGGTDEEYLDCDFWLISAVDASSNYRNSPTRRIKLWKGELYPSDNWTKVTLKVKKPDLSCGAGNDQTIILKKGETTTNVSVCGTVERGNGKQLSYRWEKGNSVFSRAKDGNIALAVGNHPLSFYVTIESENNTSPSSVDEAKDDVLITVKPYTPGDDDDESTSTASSWDPNEKVGIKGAGGKSCVRQGETMEYAIYFENDAKKARLAAQTVTVIDTLNAAFDLTTFEFTGSEVANTYINIPSGKAETTVYTDLRPDNELILKTDMKLDIDTRVLKVVYTSLDTLTYEPTQDVFAGFLPPNDSTHMGEGHFSYRVKLKDDVADGYAVKNQAHIFFDYNDEIATNTTCHVVDSHAPISSIEGLPTVTMEDSLTVSWSGIDDGAGIRYYDIYRSKNGGNYELWKTHYIGNSAIQYGTIGDVYAYYSIATDSLGFVETKKSVPDATVKFIGNGVEALNGNDIAIEIEYENGAFVIIGAEDATCNVYDLAGQLIASKQPISRRERMAFVKKGVFVVNVEMKDGTNIAKKIVVK